MGGRVRFLTLTLAGFGRYDRGTRFDLGGRSSSFTSPNELGKSTFLSGLLATLFGPPMNRSKVAAFQARHRSWNRPSEFWGELDFLVGDDEWRVRQDFDALHVKVWRLPPRFPPSLAPPSEAADGGQSHDGQVAGAPELRYEGRTKPGGKPADPEAYTRLLQDWLGLADRSLYEAMFTISQESPLATTWQIDPRISSLVYGAAVKRLGGDLQAMYGQFREITRNTRDYKIVIGPHGERNGRTEGRLDQIVERIAELETSLAAARAQVGAVDEARSKLNELDQHCEQLRAQLAGTLKSLDNWRAWIELEARLRPAVESYERLRGLNERCQQVTRPLAELRSRLAGDLSLFDQAPPNLPDRLEQYVELARFVAEARQKLAEAATQREQLTRELASLGETLNTEFANHRAGSGLADRVEELQQVQAEIVREQSRLQELARPGQQVNRSTDQQVSELDRHALESDSNHFAVRAQLEPLGSWGRLGNHWERRLADAQQRVEQFSREHDEYLAIQDLVRDETQWLEEQDKRIAQIEASHQELVRDRDRERMAMVLAAQEAQARVEKARTLRGQIDRARRDLERRFVDFQGAPADLPALWDRLHALEAQQAAVLRDIDQARRVLEEADRRTYWRRGLTVIGLVMLLAYLIGARGWLDWLAATATFGLIVALRWIYRTSAGQAAETKERRQRLEFEHVGLARQHEELAAQLGPQFLVPPEREAEWRRLWQAYRRGLERLDVEAQSTPSEKQIEDLARTAADMVNGLTRCDAETNEVVGESHQSITRARAERLRREQERDRLRARWTSHAETYFGADGDRWQSTPLDTLPGWWQPILELVAVDRPPIVQAADLVEWCRSLDPTCWARFAASCQEAQADFQVATSPGPDSGDLAREAQLAEGVTPAERDALSPSEDARVADSDLLRSLRQRAAQLAEAIAPFSAGTDPGWLRERAQACQALEAFVAERQRDLDGLPALDPLSAQLDQAVSQHDAARKPLAPLLEQFGQDLGRVLAACEERAGLIRRVRELELQANQLLADSGFASLEELAHEAGRAEGLVATIRSSAEQLLEAASELWQAVDAAPELAAQRAGELESRASEQQAALSVAERQRAELAATVNQMESDRANNLSTIEAELESLRAERAQLQSRRDQITGEFQQASRRMQELQQVERAALEGRITAHFADFSCTPGRTVELDEKLQITLRNENGVRYTPDQLSHGARDQLALAVYLATAAGFDLPFVLDDPFVNCDADRLAAIRACWDRLVPSHQLILLSHDPQLAAWAPALELREAA